MYNKWNGTQWGMRGVANDRNTKFIVLVNGHKMNTEARDGAFQETDLGLLGDVERVEVLRGPAGLVYGSGAIAGIVNVVTRAAESNRVELETDFGATSDFSRNSWGLDARAFAMPTVDQSVVATLGWRASEGLGNGVSRIYGQGSWPWPSGFVRPGGVPADGSAHETPGNWRTSVDWNRGELRVYARATHQVVEAGGLFVLDPWPGTEHPDSTSPQVMVDGEPVDWRDGFWTSTDGANTQRREYVADNAMADATYSVPMGDDRLRLHLAFDGNTNRIQRQMRPGYESDAAAGERESFVEETFGERRYTAGATWLVGRIPSVQLAVGAEQRFDDIGDDLTGRNSQGEKARHPIVSDVLYSNTAIFSEGWWDAGDRIAFDAGVRWDGHTRTVDQGGTLNGKLAGIVTIAPGHVVKLIAQSSSNNGSADNYEYGRNNFDDQGIPYTEAHYERPRTRPSSTGNTIAISGVTEDELHALKPERVWSFELVSSHRFLDGLAVAPSVSYNIVQDLFAWNQDLFRVVNAGRYEHLDVECAVSWTSTRVSAGLNHALQIPVHTDVASQSETYEIARYTRDSLDVSGDPILGADGRVVQVPNYREVVKGDDTTYVPVQNGTTTTTVNPVAEQITSDGENFLSLATNVTKLYLDWRPVRWASFHSDVRVFWGLPGRDSICAYEESLGATTWGISQDPIAKWNASASFRFDGDLAVSFFVYDILGSADDRWVAHTLRWQQMGTGEQTDLYSVDIRSYAMRVEKAF